MTLRLLSALALSFVLHVGLLVPDPVHRAAPPPPVLRAALRLPPQAVPVEPLLKNTIDAEAAPALAKPPPALRPPEKPAARSAARPQPREVQSAQRKLSKQLFYPPEAVARGIEGDVWLILRLSADGEIVDVGIATSSGHALLDNAAIRAAYAMGPQTGTTSRELIVPAYFRLE